MGESYVNVFSLTYAYKAQEVLRRYRISSRVVPTPKHLSRSGCGYSLAVRADQEQVIAILRQAGIGVRN